VTLSGYAPHRLLVSIRDQRTNVGRPGGCRRPGLHIGHLFAQQFALAGYEVRAWSPTGSAHTLHDRQSLSTLAEIGRPGVSGSEGRSVKTAARSGERRAWATSDWMTLRISGFANTVIASSARARHESCPI
jgi:hypothetical protein